MKNILLIIAVSFLTSCAVAQNPPASERLKTILVVRSIFEGTDEKDWNKVQRAFSPTVFLDYSSLSGKAGESVSSSDIIKLWKSVIPGFDSTRHQLARFQVVMKDNKAKVHYFGKADHFLDGATWIVEGVYDTSLERVNDQWLITRHKFTLDQQRGDLTLAQKAIDKLK